MTSQSLKGALLETSGLSITAPGGRVLVRDLELGLGREQVGLIGRNGAGKTSLLEVLAGHREPTMGAVRRSGVLRLVPQQLQPTQGSVGALATEWGLIDQSRFWREYSRTGCSAPPLDRSLAQLSGGELRRLHLVLARCVEPDLLLLDEPTQDLDAEGVAWLIDWIERWRSGLLVVSHDQDVLRALSSFFIIQESGCRSFSGSFDDLEATLDREAQSRELTYVRHLSRLVQEEERGARISGRRQRKKNLGRIHETGRGPSRARLNENKSYAKASQGRAAKIRSQRISAARSWAKATRRALKVVLPLELVMPTLDPDDGRPVVKLEGVSLSFDERRLFEGISLSLNARDRFGVVGPNGAGKTKLVEILLGRERASAGTVSADLARVGVIAQGGENWSTTECLLDVLAKSVSLGDAAQLLASHRFPFALAERALASLSPGERVRAALIALSQRQPPPELLILDEPSYSLDFPGLASLRSALRAWPGGLLVVSHDRSFLDSIGCRRLVQLGGATAPCPRDS